MKEYWVNVYELNHFVGFIKWKARPNLQKNYNFGKVIYRIHVKMKEPVKPKYEPPFIDLPLSDGRMI